MKKNDSITLGIAFFAGIFYVTYSVVALFAGLSNGNHTQSFSTMFSIAFAGNLLLPHLLLVLSGSILCLISILKDHFAYALVATVLFCASIFFRFGFIFFIAILLICASIGCVMCYQRQEQRLEAEEERKYREAHPRQVKEKALHHYANRQLQMDDRINMVSQSITQRNTLLPHLENRDLMLGRQNAYASSTSSAFSQEVKGNYDVTSYVPYDDVEGMSKQPVRQGFSMDEVVSYTPNRGIHGYFYEDGNFYLEAQ